VAPPGYNTSDRLKNVFINKHDLLINMFVNKQVFINMHNNKHINKSPLCSSPREQQGLTLVV